MIDVSGVGSVTFNLAAIIVAVTCLFYTLVMKKKLRFQNRLFITFIVIVILDAATVISAELVLNSGLAYVIKRVLVNSLHFLYFLTHFAIAPMFALYIVVVCNVSYRFSKRAQLILALPFYILEIIVLTNPFTHLVYYYDENLIYHRMPGVYIAYLQAAFYVLFAITALYLYWNILKYLKKVTLVYFFVVVIAGTLIQMIVANIKIELLCEAIGMMGLMIVMENDDDRLDQPTEAYNRNAFIKDIGSYFKYGRQFFTICIRITNADVYRKITGYEEFEAILTDIVSYFASFSPKYDVYRVGSDCFVLVCPEITQPAADMTSEKIFGRFKNEWERNENKVLLKILVLQASSPDQFVSLEHLLFLSDSTIDGEFDHVLRRNDLDFLLRRAEIEKAVKRGISGDNFKVFFEPIYTKEDLAICAAQAVLQFEDSELGEIKPEEFMPIAEQTGVIEELGWYTLENSLYFLGGGIAEEMGLEFIEIGLSSVQLIKADFISRVRELLGKYGVRPSQVVFDISESAASTEKDVLGNVMTRLEADGIRFFIDEYGTGFFNVQSVASLSFEGAKVNAALVAQGEGRPSQNKIIMENRLKMMNQMGKIIVIDKVDTQEKLDSIKGVKADYLKGRYFSEPISKNEFIAILRATELARMEERRAKAASEAKSAFLANMSHEIRTPINAVLGMNEVILRECKDERILEYAQNIEGAGRTLLSLINDILDFSKIEAGSMEINEAAYDFGSVINDVYNMVHIKAEQKNLELVFDIDDDLPSSLFGDEMRLRQIMVNILNNAVKYTAEGYVRLKISGKRNFDNSIVLTIIVKDTGIGIKEEDVDMLFDKFKRLDIDKNKTVEGSGLGLAITHSLLDLMGGSIRAESKYGEGSTFIITLPQKVISEEPLGDFTTRLRHSAGERKEYKEKFTAPDAKILVVDDTPMNHVVIKELLKQTKVNVESARSGAECLEKQHEEKFDIIFLDYRMPGLDGIETLSRMKKDGDSPNKDTPVIVLTANAISGARENFIREGFDDYLSKPVESNKLEEVMIRFLPAEKVILTKEPDMEEAKELQDEGTESAGERPEWFDSIQCIDVEEGLKNCGTVESYLAILKVYYESTEMIESNIRESYESGNLKDFTSYVHSLKSTSRTIGAKELSKMAEMLEKAGNENDIKTIEDNKDAILELFYAVKHGLSLIPEIAKDSEENVAESEKEEITKAQMKDAYQSILEVSRSLDYDTLTFILDSVRKYRLPEEDEKIFRSIGNMAYKLQWDEIASLAEKGLSKQE
ncbi:MAG: EAL domain-containing protein [Butyrivibrio sp.]|nr:EAL domain-containing protein [Butyrivibrio sp.]